MFAHVVMGHPIPGRGDQRYPANMPLLEALATLAYIAAVTERVGLGTEVLVLPQREPTLVAKQVSTIDTLSGGRVRLGVGVGWQESEYEALGVDFHKRGAMMDEAIPLLRSYWGDESTDFVGDHFKAEAMAMEPKPPQASAIPIWIGGSAPAVLRRVGELGDGWMGSGVLGDEARDLMATVRGHAERAGRDPAAIGFQAQLAPPPRSDDAGGRGFWTNHAEVAGVAAAAAEAGFGWLTVNATGVFVAGARSSDAMIEALSGLHDMLRSEVGPA